MFLLVHRMLPATEKRNILYTLMRSMMYHIYSTQRMSSKHNKDEAHEHDEYL